ncbi:MAG: hypothetical protein EXS36_07325 [Pedosphaera sp.]|nr:hypothetical protein [Pedosphaera sp.]
MNSKALKAIALVALIGAAWILIYRTVTSVGIDLDPFQALGRGAALETAKLLHNSGRVVLVDAAFGDYQALAPTTEAQIKAFKKAIGGTGLKIAAVAKATIAAPSLSRTGIFMEPGQLSKLISQHSDVDALVLFVGLASREEIAAARPKTDKPHLVLVANYEPYYRPLVQSRVIQLAIVPRMDGDEPGKAAGSSQSYFERNYRVITPENVTQLSE